MDKNLLKQIQEFTNLWGGFRASRVVLTANNLMVFEHLRSPATANDVASSVSLDLRATEILLDALTALGLLKKNGEAVSRYAQPLIPGRHAAPCRFSLEVLVRSRRGRKERPAEPFGGP